MIKIKINKAMSITKLGIKSDEPPTPYYQPATSTRGSQMAVLVCTGLDIMGYIME
jgi:hypothetical protein